MAQARQKIDGLTHYFARLVVPHAKIMGRLTAAKSNGAGSYSILRTP
jgi:hypothetical protein